MSTHFCTLIFCIFNFLFVLFKLFGTQIFISNTNYLKVLVYAMLLSYVRFLCFLI